MEHSIWYQVRIGVYTGVFVFALSLAVSGQNALVAENRVPAERTVDYSSAPVPVRHPSTEYRMGPGDVVRISILNGQGIKRYLKIGPEGRVVFPLAGDDVVFAGKTPGEATEYLTSRISLFDKSQVAVDVVEYYSHLITIGGEVDQPGEFQIQRDAVPIFVVRASVMMRPGVTHITVVRFASEKAERYALDDPAIDGVFVYPGDAIEFGK